MIQAVIFDSDGVLVHTDDFHYRSWKTIADREGIYFDKDLNNQLLGVSSKDSITMILKRAKKEYSEEEVEKLMAEKKALYQGYLENLTEKDVPDMVVSTLQWLKRKKIKIGVGSSSRFTKLVLDKVGLTSFFDAIVTGEDVKNLKPDPEIFDLCAQKLGELPENCLIVEDGVSGIQAGKKSGFVTCGISEAKDYYQTDYPIKDISDVIMVVTKLNKAL